MVACFIGHRTIADSEQLKIRLIKVVSDLISNGVDTFLFGSKSEFNSFSWDVVTELQRQFPNIKRINYNAPHEAAFTSKEERIQSEQFFSNMLKREVHFEDYEETVDSQRARKANKNAYIMRNQEMIDNSNICIFYYNKDYLPPRSKRAKRDVFEYQSKSGTAIAFQYAIAKKKRILNIFI